MTEQWMTEHLAPKLAEVAKACHEQGAGFVATLEYEPDRFLTTAATTGSVAMAMTLMAARAEGNIDACAKNNIDTSASLVLRVLANKEYPVREGPT